MPESNKYYQGCLLAESEHNCYYYFCEKRENCEQFKQFQKEKKENGGKD